MKRRALLTTHVGGAVSLLAGCAGERNRSGPTSGDEVGTAPIAELEMSSVTDAEVARRATYRIDLEHRTTEREFATAVVTDGPKTVTAPNPPVPENRPFVYDDSVFELSYEVTNAKPSKEFRFTLSEVTATNEESETIEYESLPEVDKAKLEQYGWEDGGPFESEGVAVTYSNESIADSALVPDPEYDIVVWDSEMRAQITVEESDDSERKTYQYTSRQVHESAWEFGRNIREDHEIVLADLTDEQEAIVSEAIESDGGYEITEGEPPEAFDRLADALSQGEQVPIDGRSQTGSTVSGSYVVDYRETVYWTELSV